MSFNEIKELRKSGRLQDALKMATDAIGVDAANIWNKRALAWVYYEYIKLYAAPDTYNEFVAQYRKLIALELPDEDVMVYDNCAWQLAKMVYAIGKSDDIDYQRIDDLLMIAKQCHFTRPSESYSLIFKAFHKALKDSPKYLEFADWWDFQNFRPEDFLQEEYNDRKMMAIVEQSCIAYCKKLLDGEPIDSFGIGRKIDVEKIKAFEPFLDKLVDNHPEYQYPGYYKAKLLLALGDKTNVLSAFLPFARKKRNDFWVWEIMAEIYPDEDDRKLACHCKALSLKTPEDFLVKAREEFARLLIKKQLYKEAKAEIKKVVEIRTANGWSIPNSIQTWMKQDWYPVSIPTEDNKSFYAQYTLTADLILYEDMPEDVVVVEFVNTNKKLLNFVQDKNKHGFFNYSKHLETPKIGDIIKVRLKCEQVGGYCQLLTARIPKEKITSPALKQIEGEFKLIPGKDFGFVDGIFISPALVRSFVLSDGQIVKGQAILSYNKKKEEWGWKGISIES